MDFSLLTSQVLQFLHSVLIRSRCLCVGSLDVVTDAKLSVLLSLPEWPPCYSLCQEWPSPLDLHWRSGPDQVCFRPRPWVSSCRTKLTKTDLLSFRRRGHWFNSSHPVYYYVSRIVWIVWNCPNCEIIVNPAIQEKATKELTLAAIILFLNVSINKKHFFFLEVVIFTNVSFNVPRRGFLSGSSLGRFCGICHWYFNCWNHTVLHTMGYRL